MTISVEEFKKDVDRYLTYAMAEDLFIVVRENNILKISHSGKEDIARSLFGIISPIISFKESRDIKALSI